MKYLYGVVEATGTFQPFLQLREKRIDILLYKDVAALVGEVPDSPFKNYSREELLYKLADHQVILEEVMTIFSEVIPFKFGSLAPEGQIRKILEYNFEKTKEIFEKIKGKIEWDLVASWNNLNPILKQVSEENQKIKSYKEEIAKKPYQETFVDRVEIGKMVKDALEEKRKSLADEFFQVIEDIVVNHRYNPLMDDAMIVNAALLIKKENEKELEIRLDYLDKRYSGKINFRCVGPLPPYSFYTLKIQEKEAIEEAKKFMGIDELSLSELKNIYREKAKQLHPDLADETHGKFERLTKSYRLLLDYLKNPDSLGGLE